MIKNKVVAIIIAVLVPLMALASVTVTVNGTNHTIPQTNERGWGSAVTAWIQAISSNTLQPIGGTFTLTNDVDFGASYGLKSSYLSTRSSNPSTSGILRLNKTDSIGWRNNANSTNLLLGIDASDNLTFAGDILTTTGAGIFSDDGFYIYDLSDSTKKIDFDPGGTTGTKTTITGAQTANRVITLPDATATLVGADTTQTLTNKTINGSNNTISNVSLSAAVTGTLPIANGGTGQTSASAAFDALAPSQGSNSGKYLTTNGTTTSWGTVDALPSQTGNNGKYLTTDGSASSWSSISLATNVTGTLPIANGGTGQTGANAAFNALAPSQTSNSGKFLTTNGTDTSWATAALTAQGQSEGSGVTTTTIKSPYNQLTTTGTDTRLIETGYNNLLLNPSFEHSTATTSWTQGSGTSCAAETTEVSDGAKSLLCTLTAATADSVYQDVTPTVKMSGINFEYGVWIKTASTTLSVCARQAAATVGSCTTVIGDSVWHYYPINYPGPSSGSVGVAVVPLSSTTGTYYIDAGYIGKARNIGTVAQARLVGKIRLTGGPFSNGAVSGGGNYGDMTASSPTYSVEGDIASPSGNLAGFLYNNMPQGKYEITYSGVIRSTGAANNFCQFRLSDGTTVSDSSSITSSGNPSANSTTLVWNLNYTTTANRTIRIQTAQSGIGECQLANTAALDGGSIIIKYFPSESQTVVNMNTSGWYVDATMDGANPDLGVANVSSYTEITNASLTLKPQSGSAAVGTMCSSTNAATAPSTGNTTCAAGSESVGINFSIPTPGSYEVCWYGSSYKVVDGSEAVNTTLQLIETPTNAQTLTLEGGTRQLSSSGNATAGVIDSVVTDAITNCSVFNWASSGIKGVRLMYEQAVSGTPDSSLILADADGNTGQRNMRFTVKPITTVMPMPLLVGGVTSNTSGMERIERARITGGSDSTDCTSSPCTITRQSGSWLSSVTKAGTGSYTLNFATGIFSAIPECTCSSETGSSYGLCVYRPSTSSTGNIITASNGTTTADMRFSIVCQGPR